MSLNSSGDEKNNHSNKTSINAIAMEQNGRYLMFDANIEKFDIVYEINGEIFREKNFEDVKDFCEFKVNINDTTSLAEHATDKTSKLPYNSLNMIIIPWIDKFYCMSCKIGDHISMKEKHCMECNHVQNLMRCRVVEKYNSVLIRQVDMKYYHCGCCNLLVLVSDIEDHIAYVHENQSKNTDEVRSEKRINENKKTTNEHTDSISTNKSEIPMQQSNIDSYEVSTVTKSNESLENISINQSNIFVLRELKELDINEESSEHSDITLYEFGCNFRISFMAHNTLIRDNGRFYCALCDLSIDEKLILFHTTDFNHLKSLRSIQFDKYFGYNLIRVLHQRAHCSICNMQFHISSASHHVTTPTHLNLLNQAKNFIIPVVPTTAENNNLPKQFDLNPTMHLPIMDAQEIKIEYNQNIESLDDTNGSIESYTHDFVYLNFKNTFYKVTFNSYNSLIVIGNGARYCFVCSVKVNDCLQEHAESVAHTKCMKKCKFIDKYNKHILRQIFLTYHCCTCNLIFTKKHLNSHLSWPLEHIKTNKTIRKNDLKSGIKVVYVKTQNEQMYPEMQEPGIEIIHQIKIKPKSNSCIKKESKIIIVCSKVFKISWDSWHGLAVNGNLFFCNLCNKNLKEYELNSHIHEEWHSGALEKTFDKQYYPNLVRNVNKKMAHCVICNSFICNKIHIILEHLNGKKHLVTYKNIIVNNDTDYCNENVLYL